MLLQPLPSSSYSASVGFYLDSSCDLLVPAALPLWPCLFHELTSCAHPEQVLSFVALPPSPPYAENNTSVAGRAAVYRNPGPAWQAYPITCGSLILTEAR